MNFKNILIKVFPILISGLFIFGALYPYWLFGEYSALGWYDEVDGQIPWSHLISKVSDDTGFLHAPAGGAPYLTSIGTQEFSMPALLVESLGLWAGSFIFRLVGLLTLFGGLFFVLGRLYNLSSIEKSVLSLTVVFTSYITYGWTFGGHGWDLSIVIWLAGLVLFLEQRAGYGIIFIIVFAGISATVSGPVFSVPIALYFIVFLLFLNEQIRQIFKESYLHIFVLITVLIIFFVINWHTLYDITVGAKSYSARILMPPHVSSALVDALDMQLLVVKKFFGNFSTPYLYLPISLFFALSLVFRKPRSFAIFLLFSLVIPVFFATVFSRLNLPIVGSYRWTSLLYILPMILIVSFASLWSELKESYFVRHRVKSRVINGGVIVLFTVTFILSADNLATRTLHDAVIKGGTGITFHFDELNHFEENEKHEYRVISDYQTSQWALPLYYGFSTYDGLQPAFSHRRTYFNVYGMNAEPRMQSIEKYHQTKQFFYFYSNARYLNYDFLSMVGIKYVFSARSSLLDLNEPVLSLSGISIKQLLGDSLIGKTVKKFFGNFWLVRPLYIFELETPWPMVFIPNELMQSKHSYRHKGFYEQLNGIRENSALIAKEDMLPDSFNLNPSLKIIKTKRTGKGIDIIVNGKEGIVIYNQVYLPGWQAKCDDVTLSVFPVNGVMMATQSLPGCSNLSFFYE